MSSILKRIKSCFSKRKKSYSVTIDEILGGENFLSNEPAQLDKCYKSKIITLGNKQYRYDKAYMNMARAFAELSQAERSKVGCIIVSPDGQIISQGFNGMPSGMNNCCEHKEKGKLVSNKEVLHAESNAITKCAKWGGKTDGATIYVTMSPCLECAKLIIQSGIKRVVYGEEYRNTEGLELLKKANITLYHLNEKYV